MLAPIRFLQTLVSFELLLVLSLASGAFTGHPLLAGLPVAAGILAFAASFVASLVLIVRNRWYANSFHFPLACVPFLAWLLLSKNWSPSDAYSLQKLTYFIAFAMWPVVAVAILIAPDPERVRRFLIAWLLVGGVIAGEGLRVWLTQDVRSIYIGDVNYLAIGRVVGVAAIVTVVIWLFDRGISRGLAFGLCGAFIFVLLIGGGRGPLLGVLLAVLGALLVGFRSTRTGFGYQRYQVLILGMLILLIGGLATWSTYSDNTLRTLERMTYLVDQEGGGRSASGRLTGIADALQMWADAPLTGHGIGSFAVLSDSGDTRAYPHNLIVELLVETGLIGVAFLALMVVVALRPVRLSALRQDPLLLCALMLLINATVNAMLSLDLAGNQLFFVSLALLTMCEHRRLQPAAPAARDGRPVDVGLTPPLHDGVSGRISR